MARRPRTRRDLNLESLETRQMLTGGVAPTAQDQYMQEWVNLIRTNPAEAATRLRDTITPSTRDALTYYKVNLDEVSSRIANAPRRQPLAWNDQLGQAAQIQSNDMATNGFQSHTGSDGSTLDQRLQRVGYTNRAKAAENAYAYSDSVDQAIHAFSYDWGVSSLGHFKNMTEPDTNPDQSANEFGSAAVDSKVPGFGKVVTNVIARRNDAPTYLLGVVYDDANHDKFYTPGEGRGGVEIDVTDSSGQTVKTQSAGPGGYQLALRPGRYHVVAKVGNQAVRAQDITVDKQNVKVDFVLSDPWTGDPNPPTTADSTASQPATRPTPAPTPQPKPQPQVVVSRPTPQPTPTPTPQPQTPPVVVSDQGTPTPTTTPTPTDQDPTAGEPAATKDDGAVSFTLKGNITWNQFWTSVPLR